MAAVSSSFSLAPAFHMEIKYNCWPPAPAPMEEQRKTHDDDPPTDDAMANNSEEEDKPGQFDIWHAIQSQKAIVDSPLPASGAAVAGNPLAPYVHPLMRRSSSLLSQKSLEVCTESLGSETGSDDFSSFCDNLDSYFSSKVEADTNGELKRDAMHELKQPLLDDAPTYSTVVAEDWRRTSGKELTSVNYHCSISRKSPPRSFPPPLPSISRRDGPCVHMRPHRRDGRLVVEAVTVPSQNYLHAQREGGRLLLSFIDATVDGSKSYQRSHIVEDPLNQDQVDKITAEEDREEQNRAQIVHVSAENQDEVEENSFYIEEEEEDDDDEELLDEEEEEVEVVDRGTVVEVKVSTQPQQQSSATKVVRSSLVINKFVGGTPLSAAAEECEDALHRNEQKSNNSCAVTAAPPTRRTVPTTTTTPAAAAAVAASTLSTISTDGAYNEYYVHGAATRPPLGGHQAPLDNKLLFTSKRRNREELLHNMRRCSQLRRPLFIWEPCCIATST